MHLQNAGFIHTQVEAHPNALAEMVRNIQTKLLGAEIMVKLKKLDLPENVDLAQAKILARHAAQAVQDGKLGYALITGTKKY